MPNFWKGKKVLVTGAAGFIGSHLVEKLTSLEASVRAYVRYNSNNRAGWLDTLEPDVRSVVEIFPGDIRDAERTFEAVNGCEIVFHLSSLIAIPYSYHAPDSYVQTNVGGCLNILNACRLVSVGKVVHTSTSEVYGTAQYVPIDESHPLQGQSPYSATKIGADMLAESYYRSFNLPVATVRPFNTYGPRQSARAVIPTIISQLLKGNKSLRLGSLHPTRDFNYVEDTVAGFLAVAESDKSTGQVINIGSGKEISIGDLVKLLLDITGIPADIETDSLRLRPEKSEVDRLMCDNRKAMELAGWQPHHTLGEGLEKTAQWIESHLDLFDIGKYAM